VADLGRLELSRGAFELSGDVDLNRHLRRSALATTFLLALPLGASAESIAQTVSKWGLIGTWATDCSVPPGKNQTARMIYKTAPGGRVIHARNFGDRSDENEVVGATLSDDGTLNLRVVFRDFKQMREYGIIKQPDGGYRTMYNRNEKNEYVIADGKFTANGDPTRPLRRCD
jgi:hypothetical protein